MTESDWLTSTDPAAMLHHLQYATVGVGGRLRGTEEGGRALVSDRKLRLFAVACCRQVWHLLTDDAPCGQCGGNGMVNFAGQTEDGEECHGGRTICPDCGGTGRVNRSRRAVEVAERYADGEATAEELTTAAGDAYEAMSKVAMYEFGPAAAAAEAFSLCRSDITEGIKIGILTDPRGDQQAQAALLREIVGNPWRPLNLVDVCDTSTRDFFDARAVAHAIYAGRHFEDMPVLADALEEAGCTEPYLLAHLRGAYGHLPHVRGCWAVDLLLGKG